MKKILILLAVAGVVPHAQASCGSLMCELNPAWDTQSLTHEHGLRMDLRYAYAKADVLRAGSNKITPPPLTGSGDEIENMRTINQALTADLDYAINREWSVAVQAPLVSRDHAHTVDNLPPDVEQAKYSALGDVRVSAKYRFMAADHHSGGGLRFGLKLPSGGTDKEMAPGTPMEASLQPGSGSTDLILGGYTWWTRPGSHWSGLAQLQVQQAIAERNDYRPGTSISLDLGANYAISERVAGLLQLSFLHRARDHGGNADPLGSSGGHAVFLSPGLSVTVAPGTHVYGFVQLPIRQYVNGEQLTPRWSATLGVGFDL